MVHQSIFVAYHLLIISISQYSPHSPSNAECHMCISSDREEIMSRTSQHGSFIGCRLQPCCLPSHKALACSSILFYMLFAFYFLFLPNTSLIFQSPCFLLSFNLFCSTWHPKLCLFNVFLTWQGSAMVWQFGTTFTLKQVSGMLPLQELFNTEHFSQKNVVASWFPLLCFVVKGLCITDVLLERSWLW